MQSSSGLAGRVRGSEESDQFDLGGYNREQCVEFVKAAFSDPFCLPSMVRLSFVVGGGKLCRQKYSDDLPKDMMAALTGIGFVEDKAASCELSSAGSYKHQHDTSKNLKFIHVFPRMQLPAEAADADDAEDLEADESSKDPIDVLAECSLDDFNELLEAHVGGYIQKKRLLEGLRGPLAKLELAEKKLIARETLAADEQALYDKQSVDGLSIDGLKKKIQIVTELLQASVDEGHLTMAERKDFLDQLATKQAALDLELEKAKAEGKAKLQQKLEEQNEKLQRMRTGVSNAPAFAVPLLNGYEIKSLKSKLRALQHLEKRGNLTMDELKKLSDRPELEEAVQVLEQRCQMWFETKDEFEDRLEKGLKEISLAKKPETKQQAPEKVQPSRPVSKPKPKAKRQFAKLDVFTELREGGPVAADPEVSSTAERPKPNRTNQGYPATAAPLPSSEQAPAEMPEKQAQPASDELEVGRAEPKKSSAPKQPPPPKKKEKRQYQKLDVFG